MFRHTVEISAVADDIALDPSDSGVADEFFPLCEKLLAGSGNRIIGSCRRITSSDDPKVSFEDSLLDLAIVGYLCNVLMVRTESV